MKRKGSMMGSSKYEYNPGQLEIDIQNNKKRVENLRKEIEKFLDEVIGHDPVQSRTNWNVLIQILRERSSFRK